jgi:uncharacterized protein (DUF1330 family)
MDDKRRVLRNHQREVPMSTPLTIVAALFIHPGREREFEEFETAADAIMRRYGGRVARRIGVTPSVDPAQPHEVHIVTFPDQQSFERYRADTTLQALAELRARAIRQTTLWVGSDLSAFNEG